MKAKTGEVLSGQVLGGWAGMWMLGINLQGTGARW